MGQRPSQSHMPATARPKRVALVIAHLGPGGAQRVVANAANALVERGLDVHVVTLLDDQRDAFDLNPRVRRHARGSTNHPAHQVAGPVLRAIANFLWIRKALRGIAPDAVLSFMTQTNVLTVLATRGLHTRTVISERNDPRLQRHRARVELARRWLYRCADLVTVNSVGALESLERFVPRAKLAFLPNPLSVLSPTLKLHSSKAMFITVTRLVEQKGVDVLLKASAKALAALPGWHLAIVGDGPLRHDLQTLAGELGIAENVVWHGHVSDPISLLSAARFFVLTSRFEGLPNALLEAMACGLPAIVSDASPGPLELVGKEEAGLIVPVGDIDATAAAIERLARDEDLCARLARAAPRRISAHHPDRAIPLWLKLLNCA